MTMHNALCLIRVEDSGVTLGDRLRKAREANGWSLNDVADKTGWHFSTIAGWERGVRNPSPDKLAILAKLYKVSADELLGLPSKELINKQSKRSLTPQEQLAEMGVEVWARGHALTQEDVDFIKAYLETKEQQRKGGARK